MDDDAKWSQLVARDPLVEGHFVYGVKSTKIFCRVTCKARLARRANVEFFTTTAQAQAAGYRPCKRCQPLLVTHTPEADKIKKAIDLIDSTPDNAPLPSLERMAQEAGLTRHHFHRLFKRETGSTPRNYALARRQDRRSEPSTISASMTPLTPFSFASDPFFTFADNTSALHTYDGTDQPRDGQDFFGELKLPSTQEVRESTIYHDFIYTPHNVMLVAFRDRKVCKIEMGGSEQELVDRLQGEFSPEWFVHCAVAVASREDRQIFQQLKDEMAAGLSGGGGGGGGSGGGGVAGAGAASAELDLSAFLQLDGFEGVT
jgi:methylphosphotriester-DNA--protein-cysteine methyltransferase